MSLKSFATKGFSLAMNGKCNNHSKKASNYANKASNLFKSCRTTKDTNAVSYTHLRAHETLMNLVCRLLLEKRRHSYSGRVW